MRERLAERFDARVVALTDSGTSALVLALRLAAGAGGTVAFPGYACIDLAAAARFAGVRVRLYDIDPATLSPDLDSVTRALQRGVDAVLVAHLYGYPADVPAVAELARSFGAIVVEDAAQGAGCVLRGVRCGAFGPLSVLSFGRGKGTTGGNGGALMAISRDWADRVGMASGTLSEITHGWTDLAAAAGQWIFGHPSLYAVPAAIPALRLGETVYHPAHEPASLSSGAAALVCDALERDEQEVMARRRNAAVLRGAAIGSSLIPIEPVEGGIAGELRFPVRSLNRAPAPRLGIYRGYPQTLAEQPELRPCLHEGEGEHLGALELRRGLLTLPSHSRLTPRDISDLIAWISSS
ncbi:MAG: DegT/DnrJ/EryC1/StrS family aminotransferase [Gemmatimonadaceae bacterium]